MYMYTHFDQLSKFLFKLYPFLFYCATDFYIAIHFQTILKQFVFYIYIKVNVAILQVQRIHAFIFCGLC